MTIVSPTVYELWDAEAGNLIDDYEDEAAALLAIRESVNEDGLAHWATVALLRVDLHGNRASIAQGAALRARATGGSDGTISVLPKPLPTCQD